MIGVSWAPIVKLLVVNREVLVLEVLEDCKAAEVVVITSATVEDERLLDVEVDCTVELVEELCCSAGGVTLAALSAVKARDGIVDVDDGAELDSKTSVSSYDADVGPVVKKKELDWRSSEGLDGGDCAESVEALDAAGDVSADAKDDGESETDTIGGETVLLAGVVGYVMSVHVVGNGFVGASKVVEDEKSVNSDVVVASGTIILVEGAGE